ncbi:MAG TPA: hypothetical protein VEF04_14040, partial [Blastocatellia bacterium]|nr:hypothetical protein [Blastocatellia bacterium]
MKAIKKLIPPLVVACLSVLLNAQSTSPVTSTSNKSQVSNISNSAELTPVQEQAVLILKQLSEKVKKIHDDELRISTEALIADILWKYDQPLARRLFQNAFRSTELISDEENPIISFGGSPRTSLRTKLLSLIIKHDPSFAEELLKSIPESRSQTDAANIGERAKLSLSLAPYLIASDPQRAGALIKQSLGNRLSFELMLALNWLRGKDRKLADDLFIQALSKVEINPETPFADLMLISFYFSDLEDKAANEPTPQATQPDSIPPNLIEPVLNLAFKAITLQDQKEQREAGRERKKRMVMFDLMDHGMMAGFLPLFEKYQPERAGIIRSRLV